MKLSFSGAPDVVASLTNVWPRIMKARGKIKFVASIAESGPASP